MDPIPFQMNLIPFLNYFLLILFYPAGVFVADQPSVSCNGSSGGLRVWSLRRTTGCPLSSPGPCQEPHGACHPLTACLCLQTSATPHRPEVETSQHRSVSNFILTPPFLSLSSSRPSPKLVLIALQLCRIALPLMTVADCSLVIVPPHPSLPPSKNSGLAADIIELLLAKLAEYIVPDASQMVPKQSVNGKLAPSETEGHVTRKMEEEFDESGQASVYVYKRENESAAEILQPLISQDSRQFR